MSAKEMFIKIGYEPYEDPKVISYTKAKCIPDKINTRYIEFRVITFLKAPHNQVVVEEYVKDSLCIETKYPFIENKIIMETIELQAINKQVEELGWLNE